MNDELYLAEQNIKNKESFILFMEKLIVDLEKNPSDWENPTIDRYLDALSAWLYGKDRIVEYAGRQFVEKKTPIEVTWNFLGLILSAAQIYE